MTAGIRYLSKEEEREREGESKGLYVYIQALYTCTRVASRITYPLTRLNANGTRDAFGRIISLLHRGPTVAVAVPALFFK